MEKISSLLPNVAYVMLGRRCPFLIQKPELIEPVFDKLCAYFNACEEARRILIADLDMIFKDLNESQP